MRQLDFNEGKEVFFIYSCSPLTRHVFNANDDALLNFQYDDNQRIEPEWYCPILPMVLVNGAEGIGTGWSTKVWVDSFP